MEHNLKLFTKFLCLRWLQRQWFAIKRYKYNKFLTKELWEIYYSEFCLRLRMLCMADYIDLENLRKLCCVCFKTDCPFTVILIQIFLYHTILWNYNIFLLFIFFIKI